MDLIRSSFKMERDGRAETARATGSAGLQRRVQGTSEQVNVRMEQAFQPTSKLL